MIRITPYITIFIVLLTIISCAQKGTPEDIHKAEQTALTFLELMDAGKYSTCWNQASAFLKKSLSEGKWQISMDAARKPLGTVNYLTLKSKRFTTRMLNGPEGEYVIIEYETAFSNGKKQIEKITVMKEEDEFWRISSYFFK